MEKQCKTINCPNQATPKKSYCPSCFELSKVPVPCDKCQKPIPKSKFTTCKECHQKEKPEVVKEVQMLPCDKCQKPIPKSKHTTCKDCYKKSKPVEKVEKPKQSFGELLAEVKLLRFRVGCYERRDQIMISGDSLNKCKHCYIKVNPGSVFCTTKSCLRYSYPNCANTVCKNKVTEGSKYCLACQNLLNNKN
jgi:hypothetical protein